jgi:hypothetical protein
MGTLSRGGHGSSFHPQVLLRCAVDIVEQADAELATYVPSATASGSLTSSETESRRNRG